MNKHRKRTGYSFDVEDGEAAITILKPLSDEFNHTGTYLVIYEDAHGEATLNIFTIEEICTIDGIDIRDLEDVV